MSQLTHLVLIFPQYPYTNSYNDQYHRDDADAVTDKERHFVPDDIAYLFASEFDVYSFFFFHRLSSQFQLVLYQMPISPLAMYQFFMCTGFYNASLLHYNQGCRLSVPCPGRLCRTSFLVFACRAPQSGFGSSGGCKAREPAASAPSTPVRKHYASPACSPPRGNPFCRCKAIAGKGLDGELLSVMLAYHRQASDAALHGVVLSDIEFRCSHHLIEIPFSVLSRMFPNLILFFGFLRIV